MDLYFHQESIKTRRLKYKNKFQPSNYPLLMLDCCFSCQIAHVKSDSASLYTDFIILVDCTSLVLLNSWNVKCWNVEMWIKRLVFHEFSFLIQLKKFTNGSTPLIVTQYKQKLEETYNVPPFPLRVK